MYATPQGRPVMQAHAHGKNALVTLSLQQESSSRQQSDIPSLTTPRNAQVPALHPAQVLLVALLQRSLQLQAVLCLLAAEFAD